MGQQNSEKGEAEAGPREARRTENLPWAPAYPGRRVRRQKSAPGERNSQVCLVEVLKCFVTERTW